MYRAECLIDLGRDPSSADSHGEFAAEWTRTQEYLLGSRAIAERVVRELRLDHDKGFAPTLAQRKREATSEAVRTLRERLAIIPLEGTRLARLTVEDPSPERAARIANAHAQAYMQKSAEDRATASEPVVSWVQEQIASNNRRLHETEGELRAYLEAHRDHAMSMDDQEQLVTNEIKETTQSLVNTRLRRIETEARLVKLRAAANHVDPFEVRLTEIDEDEDVRNLRAQYVKLVVEQKEVEEAQGPSSSAAQQRTAKLTAIRNEMQRVIAAVVASAESDLTEIQQVEAQYAASLKRAQSAGHELQIRKLEFARLTRTHDEAKLILKTLGERTSSRALGAAAALGPRVVESADVPTRSRPEPLLEHGFFGALIGALLGSVLLALSKRGIRRRGAASTLVSEFATEHNHAGPIGPERQAPDA